MRQQQMSKLSIVSALLGKICASFGSNLASQEEIIFILSNTSLKLVEVVDAQKAWRTDPYLNQEKTVQNQSQGDHVHLPLELVAI